MEIFIACEWGEEERERDNYICKIVLGRSQAKIFIIYSIKLTTSWHVKVVPLVHPLKIPILVQHAVREELDLIFIPQSISNLSQDPTVKQLEEDNCGILDRQDADEFIFSAGEIVVFRGTDGLKFNLMLVIKHLNRDKTNLRTKICGNFLTKQEQQGDCVTFVEDKDWMGADMAFAHVLRDDANDVMSVNH